MSGGEIINIGTGREYVMADVASTIIQKMGSDIQLLKTVPSRTSEIEHLYCSTDKASVLLGWHPTVDLEEGLAHTITWFRQRLVNA